ncbi:MAG: M48 family metalloprotease [Candidatus Babeliales bacterium]|jgi:hypothetical protein
MKIIKNTRFLLFSAIILANLFPLQSNAQLTIVNKSTYQSIQDNPATITHIRPNGFFQKSNIVDNRHVICTLTNRRNGKTLCNGFTLNFNNKCELPAEMSEADSKTVLVNELLTAAQSGNLVIGPSTAPLTHNIIQNLLASTNVTLASARLEPDSDEVYFDVTNKELVLGTIFLKKYTDSTLIFTLGHEIAHGTQKTKDRSDTISNIINLGSYISAFILLFMAKTSASAHGIINHFTMPACGLFALPSLFNRYKFALPLYRRFNQEINADLLSLAISESTYQYPLMSENGDTNWQEMSADVHPTIAFRTAYIQEFIQKYHELQAWFADNHALIE